MVKNVVDVAAGASYKVAHMTNETATNVLTCFETKFDAGDEVDIQVNQFCLLDFSQPSIVILIIVKYYIITLWSQIWMKSKIDITPPRYGQSGIGQPALKGEEIKLWHCQSTALQSREV